MPKNVKITTLPGLFDLLAPHSCRGCGRIGTPLCDRCKNYIISEHSTYDPHLPPDFLDTLSSIDAPIYILGPRTGLIGKMVADLKYHSVRALAKTLAELLDATLPTYSGLVSLIPLPTNSKHIRARGLDHTFLIAKHLAKLRGKSYKVEKLLLRAKNTTQVGASAAQRRSQALSAYAPRPNTKLNPKTTYLLLDDIWTTGSSMKSALKHFLTLKPQKLALVLLARN